MNRSDKIYFLRQKDLDQITRLLVLFNDAIHEIFHRNTVPSELPAPNHENCPTATELLQREIDLIQALVPTGYQLDKNK